MQVNLAGFMMINGVLFFLIGIMLFITPDPPPKLPPQYSGLTIHNEGNKTIFRYDDGSEIIYEYKAPNKASQNSSKVVSVDPNGFTISTPIKKTKGEK